MENELLTWTIVLGISSLVSGGMLIWFSVLGKRRIDKEAERTADVGENIVDFNLD